jgi:exonuclease VII large subunit
LQRGYSLTLLDGHLLRSTTQVRLGSQITTRLSDGDLVSVIKKVLPKEE